MLELTFHPDNGFHATIQDVPIPHLGADEIVIKVEVAASNPKDWTHPLARGLHLNSGDDLAGTVHAIGNKVERFQIGDRVAAFHPMFAPNGAYAEYSVAPAHTVFHIPDTMSFEEASTIPLVSMTSAITLFRRQGFRAPWIVRGDDDCTQGPLIVYGASSALGVFLVKLAVLAGLHPIIAIGGGSAEYLKSFLDVSRGDAFVDYRDGLDAMKEKVASILGSTKCRHAIDVISSHQTWVPVSQMVHPKGSSILSVTSGANKYDEPEIPSGVKLSYTFVGTAHSGKYLPTMPKQPDSKEAAGDVKFAGDFFRWLERMVAEGKFGGHPHEIIAGGLDGVVTGLRRLRDNDAKGMKFVYKISETPSRLPNGEHST